ncbi:hypothetical protein [Canibacter zhoujuaniae]|uniref:hypothetical protein n=1 Tax=Canibacter zhoujuaniae TaxID=2708343 RepID=UPI00141E5284|nr:hypothetical protein [Canibacter zhoujuaniae]
MFSLIWRFFPGPAWARVLAMLLIAAVLVWALVFYIFPAIQELIPPPLSALDDPNVQQ